MSLNIYDDLELVNNYMKRVRLTLQFGGVKGKVIKEHKVIEHGKTSAPTTAIGRKYAFNIEACCLLVLAVALLLFICMRLFAEH